MLNLKNWRYILFLIILIVWGIYHYTATQRTLGDDAIQLVKASISSEYLRDVMYSHNKKVEDMSDRELEEYGKTVLELQNVQIVSLKARGRGGDVIVRVEFLLNGAIPPDGKNVRYFKMEYSPLIGWRMDWETSAMAYYLKFW